MAKIKGWSLIGDDNWESDDYTRRVAIEKVMPRGYYIVYVDFHKVLMADTYKAARKFAIQYMRSHPNG